MTETAFTDPSGNNALIAPSGNMLTFSLTLPPLPPAPPPDFASCVALAEMHRQSKYTDAQAAFVISHDYNSLQRMILIADHQYFLEVLTCAVQFNTSSPSAEAGFIDTEFRLQPNSM